MTMPGPWAAYRTLTQDPSVRHVTLAAGTRRRIVAYARPYRRLILIYLAVLVVSAFLVIAQPLLFRRIVDDGIVPGDIAIVITSALAVALLAIVDAGLGLVGRWFSARIGEGLIFDLRTDVFAHVQRQSIAFFTRTQTGALVSRLNSDVIGAQQAFTATLGGVVGNVISLAVTLVTMVALSWQITVGALILVPIFLQPARWLGRRLQALTREQFSLNAAMSSQMTERFNVAGALLMTLFGRRQDEDAQFASRAERVRDTGIRIAMANRVFFTALTLVAALATALVYGVGGVLVITDGLTLGTLLALVALLAALYGPLTALSNVRIDIMTALVSFERVFEVLDLPPLVSDSVDATPLPRGPKGITFDAVSFRYPRADEVSLASLEAVARPENSVDTGLVLTDISLTIEPGSLVALVGPSGSGKSTLTGLVSRLYDPTQGRVLIGGADLRSWTLDSLHACVGVVSQEPHLFHDTIGMNLRYARPDATDADLEQACRQAQIWDLITTLPEGLATVVGDRGHRLSGGEKQRLAIARLLLKAPDIVILDEATAHLDSENEVAVQQALAEALRGRTSLVIAHRLTTIQQADLIVVLDNGRIVQTGTHEQLVNVAGTYRDLVTAALERRTHQDESFSLER